MQFNQRCTQMDADSETIQGLENRPTYQWPFLYRLNQSFPSFYLRPSVVIHKVYKIVVLRRWALNVEC
jgi:hypothetical protein